MAECAASCRRFCTERTGRFMMADQNEAKLTIRSFTCRCLVKEGDIYPLENCQQMCRFFGTSEEDYAQGILHRIRRDISAELVSSMGAKFLQKAANGEDIQIRYPTRRGDGKHCDLQLDAYAAFRQEQGWVYDLIGMDITDVLHTRKQADKLRAENLSLTEDSPVGLGLYHIRNNAFELVYTNEEYYRVHCGSKTYWDSFMGRDAIERIVPEDRPRIYTEWKRTLAEPNHRYCVDYRCIGENGELHWVRLMARLSDRVEDGAQVCYASYINIDHEKEAEKQAAEMTKKLLDTVNGLPSVSALFTLDAQNQLTAHSFSEEFCQMMGCTSAQAWEWYAGDVYEAIHPKDRAPLADFLKKHCRTKEMEHITYRLRTGKPEHPVYKWVSVNFTVFEAVDKRYLYAVYSDIDEIKRQDEQLEKDYLTAQAFLDSLSGTYLAALRINLSANKIESLGGIDPNIRSGFPDGYDAMLDKIISWMPRKAEREVLQARFSRAALQTAYQSGQRAIAVDGHYKPPRCGAIWARSSMTMVRRPGGEDVIGFFTAQNINRDKVIEHILNDVLVRRYDGILSVDATDDSVEFLSVNQKRYKLNIGERRGYNAGISAFAEQYVLGEERQAFMDFMALPAVLNGLEKSGCYTGAFTIRSAGEMRNKRFDFYYLEPDLRQMVLIVTDFTELQSQQLAQEEKLRDALTAAQQASVAKTAFLSRMSHEIRTPMNAIIGMDTLAAQAIGNDEKVSNCISKIGISARYLLSLINDILDMSRIESGKMLLKKETFLFREFIANINTIIYNQAAAKGLDYECIVANEIEEAYVGDAMKLQQVLINVLGNAVKFTQKGRVWLDIQQLGRRENTAAIRFVVGDTGCGISEENITRIFEPFEQADTTTTTTFGGTGLGLAITKNLVGLMGGTIRVRSIVGVGSEFTIDVPLTVNETVPIQQKPVYSNLEKLHTLVVDDDVIICEQASSILRDIGMIGEWVSSGREAVERVRDNASKSAFYDFILIDWKMPDMDGVETTRQIRRIVGPEVTIIIISSYDWESIEAEARAAGANLLVSKPLFKATLVSAFQKAKGQAETHPVKEANFDFAGRRLLLAEDNQINAEIAKSILELRHFTVEVATNGLKALEMFTRTPVGYYDAILMDVRMPIMDGLQATSNIRHWDKADAKTIPIIAMTANAFEEDIEKSRAAGMNAHLSKPIEPELLYRTLHRILMERDNG